jgi:predicted  nucleic acid-binding Zn-ribbon protein
MLENMKEQIYMLVKLQGIETEIGNIKSIINDAARKVETLDAGLVEFERTIEEQEAIIEELKKKYRDYESDTRIHLDREKKTQAKLRSVKTNREYQSLLKEIEEEKAKNSNIEDKMIECLDRMDEIEKNIAKKKDEYIKVSHSVMNEKEKIKQESEQGSINLSKLDKDRENVSRMIDPELLKKYLIIKKQNPGSLAVVPVKNALCHGCNVNLPPQLYNELFHGDSLKFCPNCQRIIYLKES